MVSLSRSLSRGLSLLSSRTGQKKDLRAQGRPELKLIKKLEDVETEELMNAHPHKLFY